MNELINKLRLDAGIARIATRYMPYLVVINKEGNTIDPLFGLEKFAELIIKECVKCSDPLIGHYIDTHTEQEQALLLAAIADYSSEIKQHFGVK